VLFFSANLIQDNLPIPPTSLLFPPAHPGLQPQAVPSTSALGTCTWNHGGFSAVLGSAWRLCPFVLFPAIYSRSILCLTLLNAGDTARSKTDSTLSRLSLNPVSRCGDRNLTNHIVSSPLSVVNAIRRITSDMRVSNRSLWAQGWLL
jgi:hypothetical protein